MSQIQYIIDGYNQVGSRVILWRTGNYQYQLEIDGKEHNFGASYEEAMVAFDEALEQFVTQ